MPSMHSIVTSGYVSPQHSCDPKSQVISSSQAELNSGLSVGQLASAGGGKMPGCLVVFPINFDLLLTIAVPARTAWVTAAVDIICLYALLTPFT